MQDGISNHRKGHRRLRNRKGRRRNRRTNRISVAGILDSVPSVAPPPTRLNGLSAFAIQNMSKMLYHAMIAAKAPETRLTLSAVNSPDAREVPYFGAAARHACS